MILILQSVLGREFVLKNVSDPKAVCLDGSPFKYYIQLNDLDNFLIHFQNREHFFPQSLSDLLSQLDEDSQTEKGSSSHWNQTIQSPTQGILSDDPRKNQLTANWSKIIVKNCDGTLVQGGRKQPIRFAGRLLYLRGAINFNALFDQLEKQFRVKSNTGLRVVVSGSGWGGLSVSLWGNWLKQQIKGQIRGVLDSAIFLARRQSLQNRIERFLDLANFQEALPIKECLSENQARLCLQPQVFLKYVQLPMLLIGANYDPSFLKLSLGVTCGAINTLKYCNQTQFQQVQDYRHQTNKLLNKASANPANAVWYISCVFHQFLTSQAFTSPSFRVPQHSELSASEALREWLSGEGQRLNLQNVGWPENTACAKN